MPNRPKTKWQSNGKERGLLMDQAKMVAETVGPTAFDSEPSVMARPLTVPRCEAGTALLVAREMLVITCCGGGGGRGGGNRRGRGGVAYGAPFVGCRCCDVEMERTLLRKQQDIRL